MLQGDREMKLCGEWETFSDPAYFDMWCVREKGERRFGHGFHLVNGDEAKGLAELLTSFTRPASSPDEGDCVCFSGSQHEPGCPRAAMSKPVLSKELREAVERLKHGSLMYRNGTAIHDNEIVHARAADLRLILSVFSDDEEGEDGTR